MIRHLIAALGAMLLFPAAALADHHLSGGTQTVVMGGSGGCCGHVEGHVIEVLVEPTRESIRRIQAELAVAGFNPGPIDGVMGPRTRTALAAFQSDQGLDHHGLLSVETLSRLGLHVHHSGAHPGHHCGPSDCSAHPTSRRSGHVSAHHCCTQTVHRYRRIVSTTTHPAEPVATPAPRTLPNYIHRTYGTNEVEALDWAGRD